MNKLYPIIWAFLITFSINAQSEQDFNLAGENVFLQITEPSKEQFLPFIRVRQYLELIDRQDWDEDKKTRRKNQVNQSYNALYVQWQESVERLIRSYNKAQADGVELKYLGTKMFPSGTLADTYDLETSFIFRTPTLQSEVILTYEVAWLPEIGLRVTSPIVEGF